MESRLLKQKFRNHFIEVFPQIIEQCPHLIQSAYVFFQFTKDMKNEQLDLKSWYQNIYSSLLQQKDTLSAKCLFLHRCFLQERDENEFYSEILIIERHLCEEEYLETIVKIIQVEKILVDIQRLIEEIYYLETISEF
jgi:hypothetical protein